MVVERHASAESFRRVERARATIGVLPPSRWIWLRDERRAARDAGTPGTDAGDAGERVNIVLALHKEPGSWVLAVAARLGHDPKFVLVWR